MKVFKKTGTNQEDIQEMNRSLVIRLLRKLQICSRADLAKKTGLKQATITYIINDFIECGLVKETGYIDGEKGRRSIGITLNSEKYKVIGVRLTRKYFSVGVYDITGTEYDVLPVEIDIVLGSQVVLSQIKKVISNILNKYEQDIILGIGMAIPGPFFKNEGRIGLMTEFPGWEKIYLEDELKEAFNLPVFLEHDANLGALAEWWLASNIRDSGTMVYIAAGQGIGAGIVIDGKVFRGALGVAGEIGHTSISFDGPLCECGNRGCLDLYISTTALIRDIKSELHNNNTSILKDGFSMPDVIKAVEAGDELAEKALYKVAWYLGFGLVNVINNFNPDIIIIGDELTRFGNYLLDTVRNTVKKHTLPGIYNKVDIEISTFVNDQILVGAGALAADMILKKPSTLIKIDEIAL